MQVHIFKGPGRIFAVTSDAAGANLPPKYAPWTPFKAIDLQKGVPTPGLDVDECCKASGLLRLRDDGQRKRRLAGRFRAKNFDDSPPGKSTNSERAIDQDVSRGNDIDIYDLVSA